MGRCYGSLLLILCVLGASVSVLFSQADIPAVKGKKLRLPLNNPKTNEYVGYLYAESGDAVGYILSGVTVDLFKPNLSADEPVRDISSDSLYHIGGDDEARATAYWEKFPHSQGVVKADALTVNPNTHVLTGDGEIYIYSPGIDMTGTGFYIDLDAQSIRIEKNVVTVLRRDKIGLMQTNAVQTQENIHKQIDTVPKEGKK